MRVTETVVREFLHRMPAALTLVRSIEYRLLCRYEYPAPVLDIGCGDGFFGAYLFQDRHQLIDLGVDIDPRQVEQASRSGGYQKVLHCNASDLPYPDEYFQSIFSNCVFEHIPNLVEVFLEIRRVLKPDGQYVFTAHSHLYSDYLFTVKTLRRMGLGKLGNLYARTVNAFFRHFNCHTPEGWAGKLKKAGLELVHHEYYLGEEVMSVFDRLLPLSAPAYVWYQLFHRYHLLPRHLAILLFHRYLCRLVEKNEPDGGALLLIARKQG